MTRGADEVTRELPWRGLLEQAGIAIAVTQGAEHQLVFTNETYRRLVGFTDDKAASGRPFRELLPEVAAQGVLAILDRVHRTGRGEALHDFRTSRDWSGQGRREERYFDFVVQPLRDDGVVIGLTLMLTEVTERTRARAAVEALFKLTDRVNRADSVDEVFELAVGAMCDRMTVARAAILLFDAGTVMRFRCWRGLSPEYRAAVEGHSPWSADTVDPQPVCVEDVSKDPSLTGFRAVFAAEGIRALAFIPLVHLGRLLGKFMLYDSEPRAFTDEELSLARLLADQVAAAVQQKLDAEERERLIAELRETLRLNQMLAAILGHDLRNPLASIANTAELISRRAPDERTAKDGARILTASRRMNRLIEQLLDYTRLREGVQIPVDPQSCDLLATTRQVVDELRASWPQRSVELASRGETHGLWDCDRLAQVMSNLVANALAHGTPDAPVSVAIDGTDRHEVVVEVCNGGVIPPERLEGIFEPFATGAPADKPRRGLGLGLYITRELVRAHAGRIEVRSDTDAGTVFHIELPRGPTLSAASSSGSARAVTAESGN